MGVSVDLTGRVHVKIYSLEQADCIYLEKTPRRENNAVSCQKKYFIRPNPRPIYTPYPPRSLRLPFSSGALKSPQGSR